VKTRQRPIVSSLWREWSSDILQRVNARDAEEAKAIEASTPELTAFAKLILHNDPPDPRPFEGLTHLNESATVSDLASTHHGGLDAE
jgi:hypothetical protein